MILSFNLSKDVYLIPSSAYSDMPRSYLIPLVIHSDTPSPSDVHSNIPSMIYLSLTKLMPILLLSIIPSSDHSDKGNNTSSLEPSFSSSLEELYHHIIQLKNLLFFISVAFFCDFFSQENSNLIQLCKVRFIHC